MQPHDQLLDLTGRTAVITGAAGGIGAAITRRLAEAGADVHLLDIDKTALDALAGQLRSAGVRAQCWAVDLRREDSINEFFTAFGDAGHTPRIWVNNAGIAPRRPALKISAADWDEVLDLNLRAAYLAASRAAQMMIDAAVPGVIVNMSSSTAHRADANPLHYRVSKTGLVSMTQSLAVELGRHGIRVVAVAPTLVNTPPLQAMLEAGGPNAFAELGFETFVKRLPLRRMAEPDDVANGVLFLVSDMAAMITGSVLDIDGGQTAK
jgi:NAD(P)-dependent dehydrogenase (short-subunit alcohol dehydrogenase family)